MLSGIALMIGATHVDAQIEEEEEVDDAEIAVAVESELWSDRGIDSHKIDVSATDGIVTLDGSAASLLAEERAIEIARAVRGVRAVVDEIDVAPPARSDADIREDVKAALHDDPAAESYEVRVSVEDAVVRLRGPVDSWAERRLAADVVRGVRGVRSVENDIMVDYAARRSDAEIAGDIESGLAWDVWVDASGISVDVSHGEVRLEGVVGSAAERARAVRDAYVAGVRAVDAGGLEVEPWAADRLKRESRPAARSDREIREAVMDAFTYDPRIYSARPEVSVEEGAVTLRGSVRSLSEKVAALSDARNTAGVWKVRDLLKVRPEDPAGDETIAAKVESAIERDPYLERYEIDVSVFSGRVYLTGGVDSLFEKIRAESIASGVSDVVEVIDNLRVDLVRPYESDWAIKDDIERELYWNPWLNDQDMEVVVENGIATLTGTVDTWFERQLAREEAIEGGAVEVRNRLSIAFGPPYILPR